VDLAARKAVVAKAILDRVDPDRVDLVRAVAVRDAVRKAEDSADLKVLVAPDALAECRRSSERRRTRRSSAS